MKTLPPMISVEDKLQSDIDKVNDSEITLAEKKSQIKKLVKKYNKKNKSNKWDERRALRLAEENDNRTIHEVQNDIEEMNRKGALNQRGSSMR